jgi:putative transposon-encoded protein
VANIKITDLTAATVPLAGTELFEVVQSGDSKKVAASAIGNSATAVPYLSLAGRAYISAYSTTDQTGSVSAATPVKIENTSFSAGISMANNGSGNPTRITFTVAGTYMLAPSLQFSNSDSTDHDVTIWFRKNGTNIANSATVLSVPKAADGGNAFFQIVLYEQVTAAQYIEVMWLPANVAVTLDYIAAGAIAPAAPSVILASERIA